MAGRISQLLDPARIALDITSHDRAPALEEVAHLLEGHPAVTDFAEFYSELLARERLDTTCLGNGLALPHARTEFVNHVVLAVGRSGPGIPFEGEPLPVKLIFVLGTPKKNPTDYLMVVSSLCKLLKYPETRDALMAAASPAAFIQVIKAAEEKLSAPA